MKLDRQKKIQPKDILCSENFVSSCRETSNGGLRMAHDFESLVRDTCADKLDESNGSFADYLGSLYPKNGISNLCSSSNIGPQHQASQINENSDSAAFCQPNEQIGTEEIRLVHNYNDSATNCATNKVGPTSGTDQFVAGSQAEGIETTGGDALPETPKHSVTIVPSSSDDGEVKYVIVVHPTVPIAGESPDASDIQPPTSEEESTATRKKIRKIPTYPVQKCDLCDYTNPFKALVNRHRKTHSEVRPFTCPLCDKSFKDKRYYDFHKNAHSGTKPFTCRLCSKTFATIGEQGRHVRYMHTGEKPHKCDRCEFRSVELHKLKRHIRRHLGENNFPCSKCPFTTADSIKLEYHMSYMHSDANYCQECDLNFTMAGALQDHKLDHIKGDPVFACALCPLTCAFKQTLTEHMQVLHKFGSPIICKDCNESFMDRNSYKIHRRTHGGHKFKCKLCPFKATYKSQINVHMYMHTDSFSSYERRKRLSDYLPIINKDQAEYKSIINKDQAEYKKNYNRIQADYKTNNNRIQAEYKSNINTIQAEYKPNKNRKQADNNVKIPNRVLSTLANQKKHECPTCEKEFKDFETLKKHFIMHLASANRGIKMNKPKITVDDNKKATGVSLEDLDKLSVFDALKSRVEISAGVPPDVILPKNVPENMPVVCVPPVSFSPDDISLDGLLKVGVHPDGMCLDIESLDGFASNVLSLDSASPISMSLDGVLPDGLPSHVISPDSVLPDGASINSVLSNSLLANGILSDGALPISISLDGVLPAGKLGEVVFPDGVLPNSISLDGVLPDGLLPDGVPPDLLLDGVFHDSALKDVLPNDPPSDIISLDCSSSDSDVVYVDGMSPYNESTDFISPDKVPEIHIESNSKSTIAEDIVDQFEKMQEEYAKANNNNDEYAKDETVNMEYDLISCLGLDELVNNMDDDDDISLSSVF